MYHFQVLPNVFLKSSNILFHELIDPLEDIPDYSNLHSCIWKNILCKIYPVSLLYVFLRDSQYYRSDTYLSQYNKFLLSIKQNSHLFPLHPVAKTLTKGAATVITSPALILAFSFRFTLYSFKSFSFIITVSFSSNPEFKFTHIDLLFYKCLYISTRLKVYNIIW